MSRKVRKAQPSELVLLDDTPSPSEAARRSPSQVDELHDDTHSPALEEGYTTKRPDRPVYLTTVNKSNPLQRQVRDLAKRPKPRGEDSNATHGSKKKVDEEYEAVMALGKHPEHFNALLKKMPKKNKRFVLLVIQRMKEERISLDTTTYNLILEKVVDLPDDIAFTIYKEFDEEARKDHASIKPDLATFQLMVRAYERNGRYKEAILLYYSMKEVHKVYPDVALYNTLISFCAQLKDSSGELTASYFVEEMQQRGVKPDVHTYNSLMNVFSESPPEYILGAFDTMLKNKVAPNRRTYNTLMRACQRTGDYDRCFLLFEELKKDQLIPDVVTYNLLIVACRDRLDYILGTGKFSSHRRTKEQKEVGLKAIAQLSMSLMTEMTQLEVMPNTYTYNALLAVLARCNDSRMFELFDQMQEQRAQNSTQLLAMKTEMQPLVLEEGVIPSYAELDALVTQQAANAMKRMDEDDEAGADRISAMGVQPNRDTYATLIEGAARMNYPDEAYRFFDEMKEHNIEPDRDVYVKILDVCALKGEKNRAFQIFKEACSAKGVTADTELYNALLNVLAEQFDPEVHDYFRDLKYDRHNLSIKPNNDSYNILLKAYLRQSKHGGGQKTALDEALRTYKEMCQPDCAVTPDTETYGILMDICAVSKDVPAATDLILDMKRQGVAPTVNTYARFMRVFVEAKDHGIVEVFEDLKHHGPQPNLEVYATLMDYYYQHQNPLISPLFEDMKKSGVEPDLAAYNVMLNFAAQLGLRDSSFKYLEELKMRGLNADIDTYNALIAVFAPSGSDFIFKVFEEMAERSVFPDHNTFAILMRHQAGREALKKAAADGIIRVDAK